MISLHHFTGLLFMHNYLLKLIYLPSDTYSKINCKKKKNFFFFGICTTLWNRRPCYQDHITNSSITLLLSIAIKMQKLAFDIGLALCIVRTHKIWRESLCSFHMPLLSFAKSIKWKLLYLQYIQYLYLENL